MEKRLQTRIHKRMKAEVHYSEGMTFSTAVDISEGGIFITTPDPLTEGEEVSLNIHLSDNKTVTIKGVTRWSRFDDDEKMAGMGVKFNEMSDADKAAIHTIID